MFPLLFAEIWTELVLAGSIGHLRDRIPGVEYATSYRLLRDNRGATVRLFNVHWPRQFDHTAGLQPVPDAALRIAQKPAHSKYVLPTAIGDRGVGQQASRSSGCTERSVQGSELDLSNGASDRGPTATPATTAAAAIRCRGTRTSRFS